MSTEQTEQTEAEILRAAIRIMRRYRGGLETTLAILDETATALENQ